MRRICRCATLTVNYRALSRFPGLPELLACSDYRHHNASGLLADGVVAWRTAQRSRLPCNAHGGRSFPIYGRAGTPPCSSRYFFWAGWPVGIGISPICAERCRTSFVACVLGPLCLGSECTLPLSLVSPSRHQCYARIVAVTRIPRHADGAATPGG